MQKQDAINSQQRRHNFYEKVYVQVKKIPYAKVSTYGAIAKSIGFKKHARQVGYALNAAPKNMNIPWYRVVNGQGKISSRQDGMGHELQAIHLRAEGVILNENQSVDLKVYQHIFN